MTKLYLTPAYKDFITFILDRIPPEDVLAFKPSAEGEARLEALVKKQADGGLTPDEAEEMQQVVKVHLMVTLLKMAAFKKARGRVT